MTDVQRKRLERYARFAAEGFPLNGFSLSLSDCVTIAAALAEVDRLRAALAAARAEPPQPAAIVRLYDPLETHAFESQDDAMVFMRANRPGSAIRTNGPWTWHPAAKDGV